MRRVLDEASQGGYGVGAFNVNNMEQIQAIMEAARETNSPVIVQASRGALVLAGSFPISPHDCSHGDLSGDSYGFAPRPRQ
jgi:fructose-bisphosphate aldolase class II